MIEELLALLYVVVSIFLLPYGYNCFLLVYGATKYGAKGFERVRNHPVVTVQLPVYNERIVVPRLLNTICELEWPREKLEILILDDSTDDTSHIIDSEIEAHRSRGFDIRAIRRAARTGFKAGALQNALTQSNGKYITVFDADFLPPPDFLEKMVPPLEQNQKLGFVQARLGHTNRGYNNMTETIALGIDCHFVVEQPGREAMSFIINFNGSGGVLRADAIKDVGGWDPEMLTEDLDMSYRMRIAGWESEYIGEVVVPGEVPVSMSDFKNQQDRWARGCVQCAMKHLGKVWRSALFPLSSKVEATLHLTNYLIFPWMLLTLLLIVPLLALNYIPRFLFYSPLGILFSIGGFGASVMYYSSVALQKLRFREKLPYLSLLAGVGVGLSAKCTIAILRGLLSGKNEFVTTPKYDIRDKKNPSSSGKIKPMNTMPIAEIILALYSLLGIFLAVGNQLFTVIPSLLIYFIGFMLVTCFTLLPSE